MEPLMNIELLGRQDGDKLGLVRVDGFQPPGTALQDALSVIARDLHRTLENFYPNGFSKAACVHSSLTACAFLKKIGFEWAHVKPVLVNVRSYLPPGRFMSLGDTRLADDAEGVKALPLSPLAASHWNGHMVVAVQDEIACLLVDTTLFQVQRPQWPSLKGMMATTYFDENYNYCDAGRPRIGRVSIYGHREKWEACWFDDKGNNKWQEGRTFNDPEEISIINAAAGALVDLYRKQAGTPILRKRHRLRIR